MQKVCYLRVLPEYDNRRTYVSDRREYHEVFKNELLTLAEVIKFNVPLSWLQAVKVEKSSVYYFFGVRRCIYYVD